LYSKGISIMANKPGRPATGTDPKITVRLPQSLIDRIDALAAQRGVKRSDIIRERLDLDDHDNRTNDPLAFLSERQFRTAMRLQEAFEIVECGALKAFDPEKVRVDGGERGNTVPFRRGTRAALRAMHEARLRLGDERYSILYDLLANDQRVETVATKYFPEGRSGIRAIQTAVSESLDKLVRLFEPDTVLDLRRKAG
jgi:hypothetical protein